MYSTRTSTFVGNPQAPGREFEYMLLSRPAVQEALHTILHFPQQESTWKREIDPTMTDRIALFRVLEEISSDTSLY